MAIRDPQKLTVDQVTALGPTAVFVHYEDEQHKRYWSVDPWVESGQVFLCDEGHRPLRFDSEIEAREFCSKHWPEAAQPTQQTYLKASDDISAAADANPEKPTS